MTIQDLGALAGSKQHKYEISNEVTMLLRAFRRGKLANFCALTLQWVKVESSKLYIRDQIMQKINAVKGSKQVIHAALLSGSLMTNPFLP